MRARAFRIELFDLVTAVRADADLGEVLRPVQRWVGQHRPALEVGLVRVDLARLVCAEVELYPWTAAPASARSDFLRVAGCDGLPVAAIGPAIASAFWEALTVTRDEPCPRCEADVDLLWALEADLLFWLCRRCSFAVPLGREAVPPTAWCVPPSHALRRLAK